MLLESLNALTTPELNGWYLYNNEYYAKTSAIPRFSNYTFDNGATIVKDATYWFKCEPITWNILSDDNGEYYLLSSVLLDTHCFSSFYIGGYMHSDIRPWLNTEFLGSAFILGSDCIKTINDENDKVFLPSYQDYTNSNYGFDASNGSAKSRTCKTTDWARARNASCSTDSDYLYNGEYWTCSSNTQSQSADLAWSISYRGALGSISISVSDICVRPAIRVSNAFNK